MDYYTEQALVPDLCDGAFSSSYLYVRKSLKRDTGPGNAFHSGQAAMQTPHGSTEMTTDAIIRIRGFSYAYPEVDDCTLSGIDLDIGPGECHCISGPTGSGKTTLALALKGLLPPGRQTGTIISPESIQGKSPRIGLVLQNPETQILRSTIGAEAAFGLENLCVDPCLMPGMAAEAVSILGLDRPLSFRSDALSMGQKYRLIVASHLVMDPHLLILDEPAGQLDPEGIGMLADIIEKLKRRGVSFLLCENRPESFARAIDFFWCLGEGGTVKPGRDCPKNREARASSHLRSAARKRVLNAAGEEIISVRELCLTTDTGSDILSSVSFSIRRGQRVLMNGMNGSGKTSLLRCLLGFMKPSSGEILIFSENPAPGNLQGKVGCLFQNPQRQIFETSVFDEVAFPLKRLGRKGKDLAGKVRETLELCSIEGLSDLSPHKLSYGQKHLVALACALVHAPELLILDDPFAGLDHQRSRHIMELLISLNEEQGTTIIWTSHEPGAMNEWAHLLIHIRGGHAEVRG